MKSINVEIHERIVQSIDEALVARGLPTRVLRDDERPLLDLPGFDMACAIEVTERIQDHFRWSTTTPNLFVDHAGDALSVQRIAHDVLIYCTY